MQESLEEVTTGFSLLYFSLSDSCSIRESHTLEAAGFAWEVDSQLAEHRNAEAEYRKV